MKDKIINIFFWIWWGLLILLHVFLYIWLKVNGSEDIIIPISFIIIWWILTLVPLIIKERLHKKRVKSNEKMYISQIIIEDEKFGKIVFEHNTQENTLLCKNPNILFGKSKPKIHIINYLEKDKELYFSNLRYVHDNQEKILKDYYNEIKIMCDEWEEHDSNGNPITNHFIGENT